MLTFLFYPLKGGAVLRKLLLILLCFALLMGNAFAASDEITNMDAQITVDSNGICRVVILADVRFVTRPTTFVFPLGSGASDITASGASFEKETVDGVECVVFKNESGFSGNQTFQCSFTLPCTMRESETKQTYTAKLPERGWDYPIHRFKLSVTFPTEITAFPRWSSSYYGDVIDNYLSIQVADNTVTARSNITFRDHETLTMDLDFQPESFALKHLSEKSVPFDRIAFILLSLLCVGYWFIALRNNQPKRKKDRTYNFQSSAGEVPCQLFSDDADAGALIAHWGNLGYILLHRSKSGRYRLEKQMDMGNERSAAERRIFSTIFRNSSFVEVPGARFLSAFHADAPILKAHWRKRMFQGKDGNPGLFLLLCAAAGFFFSLMVFDTLFAANPGRWVWIVLLTFLTLPLHRVLQRVVPCYYRPSRWLYLGLGGGAALILLLLASPAECGGFFFFNLLLQVGAGFVTRFGGHRTTPGEEIVQDLLSFRRSVMQSTPASAKQILHRDSQYFYRMLPYAEILGVGSRFQKNYAPATAEACPWIVDERDSVHNAGDFYGVYVDLLHRLRGEGRDTFIRKLELIFSLLTSSVTDSIRSRTSSSKRSSSRRSSTRRSSSVRSSGTRSRTHSRTDTGTGGRR